MSELRKTLDESFTPLPRQPSGRDNKEALSFPFIETLLLYLSACRL